MVSICMCVQFIQRECIPHVFLGETTWQLSPSRGSVKRIARYAHKSEIFGHCGGLGGSMQQINPTADLPDVQKNAVEHQILTYVL